MAYDIPVAAWILDHAAAATAINEPPDFFDNERNDRWPGVEALARLTSAPVESFNSEDMSIFYVGVQVESDWCIELGPRLAAKAATIKAMYPHPLVQNARLAVVSDFN